MSTKINQLQLIQQNLQNISLQKQQFESQLTEIESALSELATSEKSYKILGKIMLLTPKDQLTTELSNKKEILQLRLKNFEKQEILLKKNLESLQTDVVTDFKSSKK